MVQGTYVYRLAVTDSKGLTGTADVTVTVNPAATGAPVVNAGANQVVTLPYSTVLNGSAVPATGSTISSYRWTKVSGPAQFNIVSPTSASTWLNNMALGVYVFRLTATDNHGVSGSADITVTTRTEGTTIQPPVAKAGNDVTLTLPVNSTTLSGSASTPAPGSSITGYGWSKVSGPSQFTIATPATIGTAVSNLVVGVYVFRLTVNDANGSSATDDITVTVNGSGGSTKPIASAGNDKSVVVPYSTTLDGTGSSAAAGSTLASYRWTKVSGPAQFNIVSPNSVYTWLNSLSVGVYTFRLTVTDANGFSSSDDVIVTATNGTIQSVNGAALTANEISTPSVALEHFSVYPNPARDFMNFKWTSNYKGNATINLYDGTGRRVKTLAIRKETADYTDNINVNTLKKGIYYLEISLPNGKSIREMTMKN